MWCVRFVPVQETLDKFETRLFAGIVRTLQWVSWSTVARIELPVQHKLLIHYITQ